MNERIFELAAEAEDYADSIVDQGGEFHLTYTKKFAELIVRACINKQLALAANFETCTEGYEPVCPEFVEGTINGLKEGAELIGQHFGVEE